MPVEFHHGDIVRPLNFNLGLTGLPRDVSSYPRAMRRLADRLVTDRLSKPYAFERNLDYASYDSRRDT